MNTMMHDESVAVVVVGHNSARWLETCLTALFRSSAVVIYVDCGSHDASVETVVGLGCQHVIQVRNGGYGFGCNRGAERALELEASYIVFLNPDVVVSPATVGRLAQRLASNRSIGALGPLQVEYGEETSSEYNRWTRRAPFAAQVEATEHHQVAPMEQAAFHDWISFRHGELISVRYVNGACIAMRLQYFFDAGGFDQGFFLFFEEVDLCRRLASKDLKILLDPTLTVGHAWGGHETIHRFRHWHASKYRFIFTDVNVKVQTCLHRVLVEFANDMVSGSNRQRIIVQSGRMFLAGFASAIVARCRWRRCLQKGNTPPLGVSVGIFSRR
jgi:N-acetylglucosaminyl-diphospho-decaprenol L-rhamnosyltransferase